MHKLNLILFTIMLLSFSSCQFFDGRKGDEKIARVHNFYLYKSDLNGLIPLGTSASDSVEMVKRFIDNWIKQKVFLKEAENNLPKNHSDVQRKVDDYRNSLLIFNYENQILNERLDTIITEDDLNEYYEKHQNDFKLRNHIVKLNFVKVPVGSPELNKVRSLIRSESLEDLEKLEEYCINHAAGYFLDQESWFIFPDLLREIPLNPSNQEQFLRNNKFIELSDSYYRYFLYLRDYRLEGSTSPLAFQIDNIKAIILNHRKQKLINQLRKDLYRDAVEKSSFQVF
jgi:hypothetical protein